MDTVGGVSQVSVEIHHSISEDTEVNTWSGWKPLGFEVIYGSKALFKAVLLYGPKGDNATYTGGFFSREQVQPIA